MRRDTLENGRKHRQKNDYSDSESEPRSIVGMGSSSSSSSVGAWNVAWVAGGIEAVIDVGPNAALLEGNGSGGGGNGDCSVRRDVDWSYAKGVGGCGGFSPTGCGGNREGSSSVEAEGGTSTCMATVP